MNKMPIDAMGMDPRQVAELSTNGRATGDWTTGGATTNDRTPNDAATDELTRDDLTALILRAKKRSGKSWQDLADAIAMSPVWLHSAATGMNAFPPDKARAFADLLELPDNVVPILIESPLKVWQQTVPTDPCIYRLYEIVGVYGPTIKAMINEKFGNGIMSAIDFSMQLDREANPKGDRVRLTISGKYLGYSDW